MIPKSLTVDAVVRIRREAHARYGGASDERPSDEDCIDRSIGAAVQGAFYMSEDGNLNALHIAALLLFYFVKNHCFLDGNKRTGWMLATDYLLQEGLDVVAAQDEAVQLVFD